MRLIRSAPTAIVLGLVFGGSACTVKTEPERSVDYFKEYVVAATITGGLQSPESVLHDPVADVYLVSNLAGGPFGGERTGFISRIRPDGTIEKLEWIRGGVGGAELVAPKGMAITGDVLWVADVTVVRSFDRRSGKPLGYVRIEGAAFLNDLTARSDGTVYVSDSGFSKDSSSTEVGAVYAIAPDRSVRTIARGGIVSAPNGLLVTPQGLLVVTWNEGKLLQIDADGNIRELSQLPGAKLDGIVAGYDGSWIISSWDGSCVFAVNPPSKATVAVKDLTSPADLGRDVKRRRLLIPLFDANRVVILQRCGS